MLGSGWDRILAVSAPVAAALLVSCSAPEDDCRAGLDKAEKRAQSVYLRLQEKLDRNRPGGAADWARAMEKLRLAHKAQAEGEYAECKENLAAADGLLKRARKRY